MGCDRSSAPADNEAAAAVARVAVDSGELVRTTRPNENATSESLE